MSRNGSALRPFFVAFAGMLALLLHSPVANAQKSSLSFPPSAGVSIVQTLTTPEGDRESVHTVQESTARGLRWRWELVEVSASYDTSRQAFRYAELHSDIADAFRFRAYHEVDEPEEHPGYTMHALSRAVYRRLRAAGTDTFQIMAVESPSGAGLAASFGLPRRANPVRWRGTLSLVTAAPEKFPVLINDERVAVPALHLRGHFTVRTKTWEPELWVLADSAYPLILKWVGAHTQRTNVLQTIRVDSEMTPALERDLASACRASLPGVYFAFNSAVLDAASDRALAAVAELLARHRDWRLTIEGHTDSIGSAGANQVLSERRVAAVRGKLIAVHSVDGARLSTLGFGSAKPREPNATIEGRAFNRRVELVRDCTGKR